LAVSPDKSDHMQGRSDIRDVCGVNRT